MEYDFIGDIHGHADALEALLDNLGYENKNGAYRHSNPNRMAVFLGDLIDRGPDQLLSIDIARRMRDAGTAHVLMGNHELNAIGYATPVPGTKSGRHMRLRGPKNRFQHKAFIEAVGEDSDLHKEMVEFFSTLPVSFETDELRATHACWHPKSLDALKPHLNEDGSMKRDALFASFEQGHDLNSPIEIVLKGLEVDLPEGFTFTDKGGVVRRKSRIQWWKDDATNYRNAVMPEEGLEDLPEIELPDHLKIAPSNKLTFFGHYWMSGTPYLLSPKIACLDFSIAKDGVLAAYTWRGEDQLLDEHLTWVNKPDLVNGMGR
ncbi:metallophosphoesterase [Mesorhizobium sp. SP-1A]|uniref:metallophosphoesterase n=1 Tax=Mesorhizobium sp. SP-1A TaxID=3077840 RepID=UPI0028F6CEEA|nr:metallophosphoesterase [Mesorhizobium sp. SP-1A]